MRIVVVTPMQRENQNFWNALKSREHTNHHYSVIQSGVGKVNAAVAVSDEISRTFNDCEYSPIDLVAVIGYAAASKDFSQGDVVLPDKARYHDCKVPSGFIPELDEVHELQGSDDVTILTGDSFVDAELADKLEKIYGKKVLYDMEATAVCQVCSEYNIPVLVLKLVSDIPQDNLGVDAFEKFVNENSDFNMFLDYMEAL